MRGRREQTHQIRRRDYTQGTISLAKPRGDRIVLYHFNREIISNKSKELFQLKATVAELKTDLILPINRGWKITKSLQLSK